MHNPKFDVCIIGAGVAGAALGFALGKQGKKVVIVEHDLSEPDKIIGELLQPGGVQKLKEIGFENIFESIDSPEVEGYGLFKNGRQFNIAYPKQNGEIVKGRSFKYGKFVMSLRKGLSQFNNVNLIEGSAKEFTRNENKEVTGIKYQCAESKSEKTISASLTVSCEGANPMLGKDISRSSRDIKSYFLGLLLEDCPLPYPNHGHVFIAGNSPFLSYPISSKHTRLLIDFPLDSPPKKGPELENHIVENVFPFMPRQMHDSVLQALRTGPFKAMPNYEVVADPERTVGTVIIGDSLNMRHPLTGGGMTVALSDAKFLADLLESTEMYDTVAVNSMVSKFYENRHLEISTINILANALYAVFSHPELSQACFDYLRQGGKKASEPVKLLSAVSRDRKLLLTHFMAVARSGASKKLLPIPTPRKMKEAQRMISDAIDIIQPQLKNEKFGPALEGLMKVGKLTVG